MNTPPPEMPDVAGTSPALIDWLRRFSLWAFKSLKEKHTENTAVDGILFTSANGKVWKLTISNTGTVVITSVALGSHP